MHIQQKATTWLWCFSKHPTFQQVSVQIYRSLWQLVLTYIKSWKMYLHLVHIDMYSFCYLAFIIAIHVHILPSCSHCC